MVQGPAGESNNLVADVKGFGVFDDPKDELGQGFECLQFPGIPQLTSIAVLEFYGGRKPNLETPEMKDLDTQFPNCVSDSVVVV